MGITFKMSLFKYKTFFSFFFILGIKISLSQVPQDFLIHRVKKGETLTQIIDYYSISETQLNEYNPSLKKLGIKKRMVLRIPVYQKIKPFDADKQNKSVKSFEIHIVEPKETKWRLAYEYGMTINELDSLNPQILDGLKIGQEIRVRNIDFSKTIPEKDSMYNYYQVLQSEGYYRIEKKLGVNRYVLDSLNPNLEKTGLQVGMILRIPDSLSGKFKIENDLLVERVNLIDSIFKKRKIKMGLLLPFKAKEIIFDSIENTKKVLEERNLHTISLDFYSGVLFALQRASRSGLEIDLSTFDTENNKLKINDIVASGSLDTLDLIIGPLIPSNFDYLSNQKQLINIPKIAPLSSRPVNYRKNVFQSVTDENIFREKMYEYLEKKLDSTHHILIVADSKNKTIEDELKLKFPWAINLKPEKSDYIIPELVDSLLLDSIPNKIILETQSFPLIASALSQFSAQNRQFRDVQVFTTYRSNIYNNENLSRKSLGGIRFTYPTGTKPLDQTTGNKFVDEFVQNYGKPPNNNALRGYDVVLDAILRFAVSKDIRKSIDLGETQYKSNRFFYRKNENESFTNKSVYILQHNGYEIYEIKE